MTCSSSPTAVNLVIVEGDWLWYDVLSVFRLLFSPLEPMMKSPYPLLNNMIWCSFACEVLGMAVTSIMQFLRVSQLSACLEAPSWWTDDDCYASEASKKPIFIQKRSLASSLLLSLLLYRFVVTKRSPSTIKRFTTVNMMLLKGFRSSSPYTEWLCIFFAYVLIHVYCAAAAISSSVYT